MKARFHVHAERRLRRSPRRRREGASAVVVAVVLVILIGFGALVVDIGSLLQTRSELHRAADAAALAGAQYLDGTAAGITAARDAVHEYGAEHTARTTTIEIPPEDTLFGHWDLEARTFTPIGAPMSDPAAVNAVRAIGRREGEDAVPFYLAPVFGGPDQEGVSATATAVGGGPAEECGFPLVVSECALEDPIASGACDYCMQFQNNNSDNAGWTTFSSGGQVGNPAIAQIIEDACFDEAGNPVIDGEGHCAAGCGKVDATSEIQVQNGNILNKGPNNPCGVIKDILLRNGTPAESFRVRVPVLEAADGECPSAQFSGQRTIDGFATMEIFGAKCANNDTAVLVPDVDSCSPPPSGDYVVARLHCDEESVNGVAGGGFFGLDAVHVRLVE